MPIYLKQSTASQEIPLGYFVDSTDGNTAETGLTIANTDIKIWKTGATTLADKTSGGATHIAGGVYYCVLDATDTNTLGPLVVFIHVAGALAVRVECVVLAANVYDSLIAASDALQVDTIQVSGTTQTANDVGADVDAILVDTGTTIPGVLGSPAGADMSTDIAAIKSDTAAVLVDTGTSGVLLAATATSAQLVDDIWDEPTVGHVTAGTTSVALTDVLTDTGTTIPGVLGSPAGADLATDIAAIKSDTAAILTDTGTTLPGVLGSPAGADMSTDIAAIKSDTAAILVDTGTSGVLLTSAYDSAKTAITTATTCADADGLTANSLLDHVRKMSWMIYNKMAVTDASGDYTLYKDDGTTSAATGSITDNSTTTTRSVPTWA